MKKSNSTFDIQFTDEYLIEDLDPTVEKIAIITIDDFFEYLVIPIIYWSEHEYIKQWLEAFNEIIASDISQSALITAMHDTKNDDSYISTWPLYRQGEIVFVQSRILFLADDSKVFDIKNLNTYIEPRETIDEDGNIISEWQTDVSAIKVAISRLKLEFYNKI